MKIKTKYGSVDLSRLIGHTHLSHKSNELKFDFRNIIDELHTSEMCYHVRNARKRQL